MDPLPVDVPTLTCPDCGEDMRLVGIERSPESVAVHILTFECARGARARHGISELDPLSLAASLAGSTRPRGGVSGLSEPSSSEAT